MAYEPIYCSALGCLREQREQCAHCKMFFCPEHQKNHTHPLNAELGNKEFDPTKEKHHFGFVVKIIDPGCTRELQIEHRDGTVERYTSTEDEVDDLNVWSRAVRNAFHKLFQNMP